MIFREKPFSARLHSQMPEATFPEFFGLSTLKGAQEAEKLLREPNLNFSVN
ncbi:MAG: hypothetical protein LIO87_02125 [Eubacterium sp.]|nr:hypothetical protein [Eubacterium sp.]